MQILRKFCFLSLCARNECKFVVLRCPLKRKEKGEFFNSLINEIAKEVGFVFWGEFLRFFRFLDPYEIGSLRIFVIFV